MKKKKGLTAVVAVVVLGAVVFVSLGLGSPKDETEAVEVSAAIAVQTVRPTIGDIARTNQYVGRVEPSQLVAVIPRVTGEISNVYYNVGDRVQQGAVLLDVDTVDIMLQVDVAQAAYNAAKATVDQSTDSGIDSQILQLESNVQLAQLAYDTAVKLAGMSEDYIDDQLSGMRDSHNSLNKSLQTMQEGINGLETLIDTYESVISLNDELDSLQEKLDNLSPSDPNYNEDKEALEKSIIKTQTTIDSTIAALKVADKDYLGNYDKLSITTYLVELRATLRETKSQYQTYSSTRDSLSTNYDNLDNSRKIDRAQTNAQVAQARLALEAAEAALDLAKNKAIPQGITAAEAQLLQAEASLKATMRQLEYAQVTAPISGVIEQRNAEPYGFATSSSAAFVISNKDMMLVSFAVPESILYNLNIGDTVTVERSGQVSQGTITELATMVGSSGGLFTVKAAVPSSAMNLLTGTTVVVELEVERTDGGVLVPIDCVYYDNNEPYVYINEGGVARRVPIITGLNNDDYIEVVYGIGSSTEVISTWHNRLADGAELTLSDGTAG